jgi:hypothetical protein
MNSWFNSHLERISPILQVQEAERTPKKTPKEIKPLNVI